MKAFFKFLLWVIIIAIVAIVLALGYFGLVPGVSKIFGSDQPRDLGMEHTETDLANVQIKLSQQIVDVDNTLGPNKQLEAATAVPVEATISAAEYAAHIEQVHPMADVQVVFSGDEFEMSGKIIRDRIPGFIRTLGVNDVSDQEILEIIDDYVPIDPIFYFSGSGSVTNNKALVTLTKAEVGRFSLPSDYRGEVDEFVAQYLEAILDAVPAFSAESVTIENGELVFKGTASSEIPRY